MKFFDALPSKYLRASDLDGEDCVVRITGWRLDSPAEDEAEIVVVDVEEFDKPMRINFTNGCVIAEMYGEEMDDWVGEDIIIFPTTCTFGRDIKDCIRVRKKKPGDGGSKKSSSRRGGPSGGERPSKPERRPESRSTNRKQESRSAKRTSKRATTRRRDVEDGDDD
jgi:hypothetical protein